MDDVNVQLQISLFHHHHAKKGRIVGVGRTLSQHDHVDNLMNVLIETVGGSKMRELLYQEKEEDTIQATMGTLCSFLLCDERKGTQKRTTP